MCTACLLFSVGVGLSQGDRDDWGDGHRGVFGSEHHKEEKHTKKFVTKKFSQELAFVVCVLVCVVTGRVGRGRVD